MQRSADIVVLNQLEALFQTLSSGQRDDAKLKALQEISDNFEVLVATPAYPTLMENLLKTFTRILLQETQPQFIGENNTQQLRKLMLEMIHRMPLNGEQWKQYMKIILGTMFKLLELENEENSLVCLRIIIEFHKQFRPGFSHEIQQFLNFVKRVFQNLASHCSNIFEPRAPIKVNEIQDLNIETALQAAYIIMPIQTEQKLADGTAITYTLLPRGVLSLKVLAELPISIILFHQVYKQNVQQDMMDFIPLIMNTLTWFPTGEQLNHENFNREILIDFLSIQVKAASFFAVLCRTMPDCVANYSASLVKAVPTILHVCPPEISAIRKDLTVAFRHLLATDLRTKFIPYLNQFFNDSLLLGTSFTAFENLRALSYSTLADLVHHSRNQLSLQSQSSSIHYFSRVVFDSTLPCNVHNMSIKLLLNLIEGISKQNENILMVKDMILYLLEIFVRKFKEFSVEILPVLFEKCERRRSDSVTQMMIESSASMSKSLTDISSNVAMTSSVTTTENNNQQQSLFNTDNDPNNNNNKESESTETKSFILPVVSTEKDDKLPYAMPTPSYVPSVNDARNLVKMLVYGAKTISWGLSGCRFSTQDPNYQATTMTSSECEYFVKIVKYGLLALDIYTIVQTSGSPPSSYQRSPASAGVRSKEEKDVMDHFAGIFNLMNLQTFKEIFSTCIDYLVDRIGQNHALQLIPNSFLCGNVNTSPTFGGILLQYLVKRMHLMGTSSELSSLYLKLLKLIYGSVSVFPAENEQMLRPYLHKLVNNCIEMAIITKEPYNYLLLLRGLFRSIGGGSHDVLYQEFLPVLPGLLKNLNALQSSYHPSSIRELIVELCLTVPVRLSSLVPHIPMLMEPLVLALNGSSALVLQGLRTLELCIDNLQPEFLHEHMGSVRSNLMHALWNIVQHGSTEQASITAWRTIGKLGGLNRKVLTDKQKLERKDFDAGIGPNVSLFYLNDVIIEFNITKAISFACDTIKRNSTTDAKIRTHALKIIQTFVSSCFHPQYGETLPDDDVIFNWFFSAHDFSPSTYIYRCSNETQRHLCIEALSSLLSAATSKETRQDALTTVNAILRHITFLAVFEEIGYFKFGENFYEIQNRMDTGVLADAVCKSLSDEDKESCKAGVLAMTLVLDTANNLFKNKEKVFKLTFIDQLFQKVVHLCYEPAWYAKLGGCAGVKFALENFPTLWSINHVTRIFSAMIFVIHELANEIANGTVDFAKSTIDLMLKTISAYENHEIVNQACYAVVSLATNLLYSSFVVLRELAISVLETVSGITKEPIGCLIEPVVKNVFHWLNTDDVIFTNLSPQCQIGILEAIAYVCGQSPSSAVFDPKRDAEQKFFDQINQILTFEKLPSCCLGLISDKEAEVLLLKLKQSSLKALLSYKNSPAHSDVLFTAVFNALTCDCKEIQDVAYTVMVELSKSAPSSMELLHNLMKPLLLEFSRLNGLSLPVVSKLFLLTKLFPVVFTEKLCDILFSHLNKWLEVAAQSPLPKLTLTFLSSEMEVCAVIVEIFQYVPSATARFIDFLVPLLTKAEVALQIGPGSPWRKPLMLFLTRYPAQTIDYLFLETNLKEPHIRNYLIWFLKQEESKACREILLANPAILFNLLKDNNAFLSMQLGKSASETLALHLIRILSKRDPTWLRSCPEISTCVHDLWKSDLFRERFNQPVETFDSANFIGVVYAAKCLLTYFQSDITNIDVLFDLARCFQWKLPVDLNFLRKFLEKEVAQNYSVDWKRRAFFKFVEYNANKSIDIYFKTTIIQYIIIPCVSRSFEKGEIEQLIGCQPSPESDSDDNLLSIFMSKVISAVELTQISKIYDVWLICLYQLTSLFVEYASPHIHDGSKRQGARLRTVMMFGWPCLQQNNYMDPIAKYYGHLLIAHIINKFAINRKIVLQVFHSLLKAHGQETRYVVRQALNILTPAVPLRMEDGQVQLAQLIKKTFIEEGYSSQQTVHLLQLLTRHYKVFYNVRHRLMQFIIPAMQKVAVQSGALEHRRLAVDVCEMIIKWEIFRLKGDTELTEIESVSSTTSSNTIAASGDSSRILPAEVAQAFDKAHVDIIANFLIRLACQPSDPSSQSSSTGSNMPAEAFSKRCLQLVRIALKTDMWGSSPELKIQWIEKALASVDQTTNISTVCVCLDVLTFVIGCLGVNHVISLVRPIQRGLVACLNATNSQMVKSMYGFITKLLSVLTSDPQKTYNLDEFDLLNSCIQKILSETLSNYEKIANASISSLGGALMLLKALCNANSVFVDRILPVFVKTMQKLARDYAQPVISDQVKAGSDMLVVCLDLIRSRMESMNHELRKQFVSGVIVVVLEKSNNPKLVLCIIKLADDWLKNSTPSTSMLGVPSPLREKQTVLTKLMLCVEKKFPLDHDVTKAFLELAYTIFKSEDLKGSEFQLHLRSALVMGLTCSDFNIREKYVTLFNEMLPKNIFERLYYIVCSIRWDCVSQHYWIKQCIEILLLTIDQKQSLNISKIFYFTDLSVQNFYNANQQVQDELMVCDEESNQQQQTFRIQSMNLWHKGKTFLQSSLTLKVSDFMPHFLYLCNEYTNLAENVWLELLPAVWNTFTDAEKLKLANEVVPFLSSKYHCKQSEAYPSVIKTFVEAFSTCQLPYIKPQLLRYLGRSHGLWHKSILLMEESLTPQLYTAARPEFFDEEKHEILDCLGDLYASLNESDMWTATWTRRCKFPETNTSLSYIQHGMYAQASECLEKAMSKEGNELSSLFMNLNIFNEFRLWEDQWIKCMQELNQWDLLQEYAASKNVSDPFLMLESAWRVPNWPAMKEALFQIEHACPANYLWKLQLYRGYYALCSGDQEQQHMVPGAIDRLVELTNQNLIREWRKLPRRVIGRSHVGLLQAAQQVVELTEGSQLINTLLPNNINRTANITEMKSIVKTWRNRSPAISDSLSHWSQIFSWRLFHYQNLINCLEMDPQTSQNAVLGVHAFAQCLLHFAKAARKRGLISVAVDVINRLHTIPNLPVVDGYQKLREQVKCCVKGGKQKNDNQFYIEALDLIENTNISYFVKETSGEFYALKGATLSQLDRLEEANQAFSASLQLCDSFCKSWAYWGDHLESVFMKENRRSMNNASQSMVCFLQAARLCAHENKARKYMSRVMWLLKFDNTSNSDPPYLLHETLTKFTNLLPPLHWIVWIPELLTHLKETCRPQIVDLLARIGKAFPETLFYAFKFFDWSNAGCLEELTSHQSTSSHEPFHFSVYSRSSIVRRKSRSSETSPLESWQKCMRDVFLVMRETHSFLVATLSKTSAELCGLQSKHWAVTSLRLLRNVLNECFKLAFENRQDCQSTTVPISVRQKLRAVFEIMSEDKQDQESLSLASAFEKDFDLDNPSTARLLHAFMAKLVKWIKALESKVSVLPRRQYMPETSEFLSSFSNRYLTCDMPTEIFSAKQPLHFRTKIAKFLPEIDLVKRGNLVGKRIWIRSLNGKKHAFLIVSFNGFNSDTLKWARVIHILHTLNGILAKNTECASRLLQYHVPNLIPIGQNTVLISDDSSSATLLDLLSEVLSSRDLTTDDVILRYFDKLTVQQSRLAGTGQQLVGQHLRDILKDMQNSVLPRPSFTQHLSSLYTDAESYLTLRKQFCQHLSLLNLAEYVFNFTALYPDRITLEKDSGFLAPTFFKFDWPENSGELERNRPVHCRITPCLTDFLGFSIFGQSAPTMLSVARCFNQSNLTNAIRLFLYDECVDLTGGHGHVRQQQQQQQGSVVDQSDKFTMPLNALNAILSRVQNLSTLENGDNKVQAFIASAQNPDNLCMMDPVWHPWF